MFVFGVTPLLASGPMERELECSAAAMWVATALIYRFSGEAPNGLWTSILKRTNYTALAARLSQALDRAKLLRDPRRSVRNPRAGNERESIECLSPMKRDPTFWFSRTDAVQLRPCRRQKARTTFCRYAICPVAGDAFRRHRHAGARSLACRARIDAVRSMQERYRHDVQEQEMRKLAAEAELRALRAQVNPHFLFNALTTSVT